MSRFAVLTDAAVALVADLDRADLERDALPSTDVPAFPERLDAGDLDRLAGQIAGVLDGWLSTGRTRTLARYACLLEATHHPQLRTILEYGAASRTQAQALLAAAGAADPAQAGDHFVACVDGLLFDRLAGAGALSAPPPGTAGEPGRPDRRRPDAAGRRRGAGPIAWTA